MITLFRNFTQTLTFKVIMGLLVLGLAMFGFKDVFNPLLNDEVIKAGHSTVSANDFRQTFEGFKAQQEQQAGGKPISNEDAVKANLHTQILNQMAQEAALKSQLIDAGLTPSPKLITDQLKKYPRFFNKITGQFDKQSYLTALRDAKITEATFEGQIRDSIMVSGYGAAITGGLKAPKIMAALQSVNQLQSRDISYFVLDSTKLPVPADPNEKELTAFYNQVKPRLTRPELRQFVIVSIAPGEYAASIPLDEAELKKMYEFRKDTLAKPELRSFVQVTAPDAASAKAISDGLRAGQAPEAVAKAHKGTVLAYDTKPKTAVPDSKVADMAFTLRSGDVSAPIQGNLGLSVIKVGAVTPGTETPFVAVREQYAQEYRHQKALDKVYKLVEDLDKARESGTGLVPAAEKLGIRTITTPFMTAEGATMTGQSFAQFEKVIKTAFEQPKNGESEVLELGNGEYYAVKLVEIMPPLAPEIKDIRAQLIGAYKSEKMGEALQTQTDKIVASLNKGESINTAASGSGAQVVNLAGVDIQSAPQKFAVSADPRVGQALVSRAFVTKPKESFSLRFSQNQTLIGVVNKAYAPPAQKAIQSMPIATLMGARTLSQDVFMQSISAANTAVKPKIYPKSALRALGVAPVDEKAETPKDNAK